MKTGLAIAAVAAALAASGAAPAQNRLTEDEAARIVERLPAVAAYARRLAPAGRRLVLRAEQQPEAGCNPQSRECRWCFYVGESDAAQTVRWQTICVRPDNRAVTVIDPVSDEEMTYAAFERAQRGASPGATPPAPTGKPPTGK